VTQPLIKFAKMLCKSGDFINHEKTQYYKEFLKTYHNLNLEINNLLNTKCLAKVNKNRISLVSTVQTIIFLGRQNISLRGHRDDGILLTTTPVNTNNQSSSLNEGNFRELLKFRVKSGDNTLENHIQNSSSKATYINKTT
jgi:hypothetical protein